MTSPASGKFLVAPVCGMYSIDIASGALTSLADPSVPNATRAVFDPTSQFMRELTSRQPCFHRDRGEDTFQVDPAKEEK
jgi:hypothetical protein